MRKPDSLCMVFAVLFAAIKIGEAFLPQAIISKYKQTRLRLREDVYFGNLPILEEYDFVIVGASPSGCVLANRLSENPYVSVLLLEAGAEENPYSDAPAFSTYMLFSEYNWKYKAQRRKGVCRSMIDGRCTWPSGKGIGGATIINGMIFTRGNRRDFDRWEEAGNPGWGWEGVFPYFKRLEDMQIPELRDSDQHGTDGPVTITYTNYKTKLSEKFLKGGVQSGYNLTDYNSEGHHIGFSRIQSTIRNGKRCSASKAYLAPVSKRPNLHISQKSLVTKVIIDPITKLAIGVEFVKKGKKRFVRAKREVILSAGSFNTPKLLMLSGVGPEEHLVQKGIPVIAHLPVGENLQEHIGTTSLAFIANKGVVPDIGKEILSLPITMWNWERTGQTILSFAGCEALAYLKSSYAESGDFPDIELVQISTSYASDDGANLRKTFDVKDDVYNSVYKEIEPNATFSIWVMGMYPLSKGSVKLDSKNPFKPPLIYNNFMNDTRDLNVVVQGIKAAVALTKTPAMRSIGAKLHDKKLPNCKHLLFGSDDYWACFVRDLTSQFHHQCGTCKMGPPTDPSAVVNSRLKVYGVSGLRVVDASIMPTITGGHTMAPSYMIGEKAADIIKEDHELFF
ncbi:glucose dehydrogenase [FAD, quinone]-like [Cimex lectularius]|uniref:Glucose-methanol-choline oxidoreductase N-terminal domain-containing protein n=1 Tax=Cimex lectularius TaxID=79782 RepID=A0A8I6RQL7_CIMLE|nr:glucose dehydrogenase [FAD, quinone]-like [Cimex lectularius]XP_024083818.1 glucose dehydrogenase [FAD, quinone]-like [Cimex lectularius]